MNATVWSVPINSLIKNIFVIKSTILLNLFCTLTLIIIELYGSNSTTETPQKKQFNLKIYPLEKRNNLFLALLLHFRYIEGSVSGILLSRIFRPHRSLFIKFSFRKYTSQKTKSINEQQKLLIAFD